AWDLAKESFYRWDAVPYLKFRTTYGHAGNVNTGHAAVTTLQYRGFTRLGRFPYAIVDNPPNPELRWENVATWNIGLDFASRRQHMSGSLEYYIKSSSDLIASMIADPTIGFSTLKRNSAAIRSKGIDLSLQGQVGNKRFGWVGNLMFSYNTNVVREYYGNTISMASLVGTGSITTPLVGQTPYALASYRFAGLDPEAGDPLGYLNGEVS